MRGAQGSPEPWLKRGRCSVLFKTEELLVAAGEDTPGEVWTIRRARPSLLLDLAFCWGGEKGLIAKPKLRPKAFLKPVLPESKTASSPEPVTALLPAASPAGLCHRPRAEGEGPRPCCLGSHPGC